MFPRPNPVFRRGLRYVGQSSREGAGLLTFPAGAAAGHLAIIATTAPTLSGWNTISDDSLYIHWKRLTAGEVASGVTLGTTSYPVLCVVYAGAIAVALSGVDSQIDPLRIPGFVRSAGALAIVTVARASGGLGSAPVGFTYRSGFNVDGVGGLRIADVVPASLYVDETAITWPTSGGSSKDALALELF